MSRLIFCVAFLAFNRALAVPPTTKACKASCEKAQSVGQHLTKEEAAKVVPSIPMLDPASAQRVLKITREAYAGMAKYVAPMCSDPTIFKTMINETLIHFVGSGSFTKADLIE